MFKRAVEDGHKQEQEQEEQMAGDHVAADDVAADHGTAATDAPPRDISPTAGEQEPAADVRPADAPAAAEPREVPAAEGNGAGLHAEPVASAERTGAAEPTGVAKPSAGSAAGRALLDRETLQRRWQEVQTSFVDEPRHALEEADSLVSDTVRELADSLTAERAGIERDWHDAEDAATEDFRLALLRYRDVFQLVLSV